MSADGVFGSVIDYDTLAAMPEYEGKTITQEDLAKVALDKQASGEYDAECMAYVENLKKDPGYVTKTVFSAYNATGHDLNLVCVHDFKGEIVGKPYPLVIKNGQLTVWLDVPPIGQITDLSTGIVYRGKNSSDTTMDWILTWSVPYINGSNKVYTEISEKGHYEKEGVWDCIQEKLSQSGSISTYENNGCKSDTSITRGPIIAASVYKVIMNLTSP